MLDQPMYDTDEPRTTAGRTILTVLAALALACLLSADALVEVAEQQEFGSRRDLALAATHPVQDLSHALGLHLPRLWLAQATGNESLPTSTAGLAVEVPSATVPRVAKPVAPLGTTATTIPTTTTLPPRRTPTAEDPLRVAMMGDSLMGHIGIGLGRLLQYDPRVRITTDFHVSTGLARPDRLDWPTYLSQQLPALGAEVVYLSFGANDDQDMQLADGTRVVLRSPEWQAEYARRVGLAMDTAVAGDRTVVWLGLPAEEPPQLNEIKDTMNAVAREQAALRPRVTFLDVGSILTPDGAYRDTYLHPDGAVTRVREPDGVHLSIPGGEVLAPALLSAIATEWNLAATPG
jgi:uncharacterized protein